MSTVLHSEISGNRHNGSLPSVFPHDPSTASLFQSHFDHTPFLFHHSLHTLDIFKMPALLSLAQRCMKKKHQKAHYEAGEPIVTGDFGQKPADMTLVQALERIAEGRNWIILKRIHEEPEYREALEAFTTEISQLTGINLRKVYYDPILTIFITSPNRITPYHLDSESNFLAQVQGGKTVYLYNANDRSVMTNEELERYWTGHLLAPRWREDLADGQWHYDVQPGTGVFNPATFPHWVKNGNNVSVSVSINFKRVRNDAIGAYRMNYYTRKMGLKPRNPGESPAIDRAKELFFGKPYTAARGARKYARTHFGI